MRSRTLAIVAALAFVACLIVMQSPPSAALANQKPAERLKWEYTFVEGETNNDPNPIKDRLNKLGADGWEVCGTLTQDNYVGFVILKRPK